MPYVTQIHVKKCRNVRGLDIDLSVPRSADPAPVPSSQEGRAFRHLIITGPNGSGKSGVLEGVADALVKTFFSAQTQGRFARQSRKRRHSPLDSALYSSTGGARLNTQSDVQSGPSLELDWSAPPPSAHEGLAPPEMFAVYLPPKRHIQRQGVRGSRALEWKLTDLDPQQELATQLLQFLVNKKTEQAFALANGNSATAKRIEHWFEQFRKHLRRLTGDPDLELIFDERAYNFHFRRHDGYVFDLNTLADGHSAALSILAELLLRTEAVQRAREDYTFEPYGIVIVDEIETHLHLALQEQILPFLTELFPRLQFMVATHSPAVIASIPGAIVCDLGTREQVLSDHYRGIPYGVLMKEHFGISSEIDLDSTRKLLRLRELAALPGRAAGDEHELRALAAELTQRSPVLATEVWMVTEGVGTSSVHVGERDG
jgi:hypothetical protein